MERLTDYHVGENGAYMKCSGNCRGGLCENCEELEKIIDRLAAYEDTGMKPEEVKEFLEDVESRFVIWINKRYGIPVTKFMDIMQAEKDGRLVVLPCKAGSYVWVNGRKAIVEEFFGYKMERYLHVQFYDNMQYIYVPFEEIGKTVFLTREEADAAMKNVEEICNEVGGCG